MANRITKVTTKKGDQGSTRLADGKTYFKFDGPIELVGALDEANCAIGVLVQFTEIENLRNLLTEIQSRLFDIGAAVATGIPQPVWSEETQKIEEETRTLNRQLGPLREFILPGGGKASAFGHMARSLVRKAEREFWKHASEELIKAGLGAYLNRVSDFLFELSRKLAHSTQSWNPIRS